MPDSVLSRTHYVALFSRESLASDLANRLSKVANVPVASEVHLHTLQKQTCFARNGLRKGLRAKYTITCFSGNGQHMRTNIVAIGTRPSFFLNFN